MCGHGSGNGTPCAGRAICASFDPLGVYIYAVGVESCATRLPLLRSVPLTDPNRGRAWHPREFGAVLGGSASHTSSDRLRRLGLQPRVIPRSMRRRSRRLRGDTRRNALSAGYRLLALRRVSPRIRRTASLHVAQFSALPLVPCLTFHKARFSFVASAATRQMCRGFARTVISPRLISARRFRYNTHIPRGGMRDAGS